VGLLRKKLVEEPGYPFKDNYGGECPGVYYHRLQRDGWKLARFDPPAANDQIAVFEKPLPKGWVLEKSAHASIDSPTGSGCYYDTHRLIHPEGGTVLDHPEWEWAELDRKRLVWVTKGVLYAAKIHGKGLGCHTNGEPVCRTGAVRPALRHKRYGKSPGISDPAGLAPLAKTPSPDPWWP